DTNLTKNLPNVQVSDLHYDSTNDILIVGTYGRGAWVIKNARNVLSTDPVLTIKSEDDVTNPNNDVILKRDKDNPLLLNVYLGHDVDADTTSNPVARVPLNAYERINVVGTSHDDTLIIDTTNGN